MAVRLPDTILSVGDFACINGGQAKVAIESARLLADSGRAVHFVAACGEPDRLLDHPRITVEVLGQQDILSDPDRLRAFRRGIWNGEAQRRLSAAAARFDPATTVLHCHGHAKALSPAIGPVLADGPLRSVYTAHEYFLACPNGGFYDYQAGAICNRRALGADCLTTDCDARHAAHKVWRVARQFAGRGPGKMPRGLRDVIAISALQRARLAPYLAADAAIHLVPNAVEPGPIEPVPAASNTAFVFVGRLAPEKGGLQFAQAAHASGVEAVFVGDGEQADAVRAACPSATITGWQDSAGVAHWLGRARALVFPSLWPEPFGLVAYEALNRGVPVIAGAWNAASEFYVEGQSGVTYHEPTAAALSAAIERARTLPAFDPGPFRERSSPQRHLEALLAVYGQVLARA